MDNNQGSLDNKRAPDNKVYGAHMGPTWGRKDPGGPHVGPMDISIQGMFHPLWIVWAR